jgi:hypothetical protein
MAVSIRNEGYYETTINAETAETAEKENSDLCDLCEFCVKT